MCNTIQVLEELDTFKKGNDTINYEAREFIRHLDSIAKSDVLTDWIPLNGATHGKFKVVAKHDLNGVDATKVFDDAKADHQILNATLTLQRQNKDRTVILVSKDIALRLKAKSLNIIAEDYLKEGRDVRESCTRRLELTTSAKRSLTVIRTRSMPVEGWDRKTEGNQSHFKHKKKLLAKFDRAPER